MSKIFLSVVVDWVNQQFPPGLLLILNASTANHAFCFPFPLIVRGRLRRLWRSEWSRWSPDPVNHCSCSGRARQYRYCTRRFIALIRHCSGPSTRYVDCHECSCNNGGCDHICEETYHGRRCSCSAGYKPSGSSCIGMWILRLEECSQVSLALQQSERGFVRFWGSHWCTHYDESKQPTEERKGWSYPWGAGNEIKYRSLSIPGILRHNSNIYR